MGPSAGTTFRIIAFTLGGIAVMAAFVELARDIGPASLSAPVAPRSDKTRGLERCKSLSPEDAARDMDCRALWSAMRDRFFGLSTAPASGGE